ncbi:MAG: hypothetical protein CVV52_09495 [Spirochaetae bacterium HGW-Spirochaetae-8]|jgi:hypothetical protein|nr:MAG: hypothetical protein CVV52_09495 [Spirochaetae bacterium HGW-Spirochaetae-8]
MNQLKEQTPEALLVCFHQNRNLTMKEINALHECKFGGMTPIHRKIWEVVRATLIGLVNQKRLSGPGVVYQTIRKSEVDFDHKHIRSEVKLSQPIDFANYRESHRYEEQSPMSGS